LGLLLVVLGLGRPAVLGLVGAVLPVRSEVRPAGVEEVDALLDALERLDDIALQADQHVDGVLVGAAANLLGVGLGFADDAAALGLGLLGEPALVDEERCLLLGAGDDSLRFLLGLLDDPLALGIDPLRGADFLGDGDAEFVDQAERSGLVDDDVVGQRESLAVRDDRLEALDEEDDVDLGTLRLRATGTAGRRSIMARRRRGRPPKLASGPAGGPTGGAGRARRSRGPTRGPLGGGGVDSGPNPGCPSPVGPAGGPPVRRTDRAISPPRRECVIRPSWNARRSN
jgi:hypothetical protein